jgi:DNA-binding transcriptional MerR regulator
MTGSASSEIGRAPLDKSPDAFRTISEVADDLDVPQHVLRFWETRFGQIKPLKRGGGRRYYRRDDIDLLKGIRHLLYGEGYTIKGVQRILRAEGVRFVQAVGRGEEAVPTGRSPSEAADDEALDVDSETDEPEGGLAASPDPRYAPGPAQTSPEPAPAPRTSLTPADLDLLQSALDELRECERVLAAVTLRARAEIDGLS